MYIVWCIMCGVHGVVCILAMRDAQRTPYKVTKVLKNVLKVMKGETKVSFEFKG